MRTTLLESRNNIILTRSKNLHRGVYTLVGVPLYYILHPPSRHYCQKFQLEMSHSLFLVMIDRHLST